MQENNQVKGQIPRGYKAKALKFARHAIPTSVYRRLLRFPARVVLGLLFSHRGLEVNIGGVGIFRLSPEFYFRGWESFGDRHNSGFYACIEEARQCSTFLDVGAHVGLYSLPISRALRPGGRVYAFEPASNNFHYLLEHIRYNNITNIDAYPLVVADCPAKDVRFFEHIDHGSGFGGLARFKDPDSFIEIRCQQTSIDSFCLEHGVCPDIVKIDVEGAELLVLRGAKHVIRSNKPIIFLSVHPGRLEAFGASVRELLELIESFDYSLFTAAAQVEYIHTNEYVLRPRSN